MRLSKQVLLPSLIATILFSTLFAPAVHAQAPASGQEVYGRIAPYIDEGTWLVAHADLAAVDAAVIRKWVEDRLMQFQQWDVANNQGKGQQHFQELYKQLGMPTIVAQQWLEQFKAAGGRHVYLLVSVQNVKEERPPILVFPVEGNAQPEPLANAIFPQRNAPRQMRNFPVAETVGNVVVFGEPAAVARMREMKPVERPVLRDAFLSVASAPLCAAAESVPELAKIAAEEEPKLPRVFGGQDSAVILGDVKWATAAIQLPPNVSANGVVQAANAESARRLEDLALRFIDFVGKQIDPSGRQNPLQLLRPQVQVDRLTVSLTQEQLQNQIAPTLAGALVRARENAMRVASASNMRQLTMVMMMFATQNKGQYPPDMQAIMNHTPGMQRVVRNPMRPEKEIGYIYIKPVPEVAQVPGAAGQHVVLYEDYDNWGEGINVAFLDGHVEFVNDEQLFKRRLAEAKKRNQELEEGL